MKRAVAAFHAHPLPSSFFVIFMYRHFHVSCLCYVLYLYPCFCWISFIPLKSWLRVKVTLDMAGDETRCRRVSCTSSSSSHTFMAIFMCLVCAMFYTYTNVFVGFLLFSESNRQRWIMMQTQTYSYSNPLIPSVFPLCKLYIHHRPVLNLSQSSRQVNFTMTCMCEYIITQ